LIAVYYNITSFMFMSLSFRNGSILKRTPAVFLAGTTGAGLPFSQESVTRYLGDSSIRSLWIFVWCVAANEGLRVRSPDTFPPMSSVMGTIRLAARQISASFAPTA
jgi:hypothetical protein